jgi:ArsR family transcriptional regulator, arsenate/arsenite/antimonite-responsive transcriptional repressor / arsenate reductase (thioredoxin)
MDDGIMHRAAVHAALGEPVRLAIVDELVPTDRAPSDLAGRLGLTSSLLAHHLDVLERVGLIERVVSAGDRRRRYVRLRIGGALDTHAGVAAPPPRRRGRGHALFVCTHNSARSQIAAALWTRRTGERASSAGTRPADRVHPGAVAAATRAGLDMSGARPRALEAADLDADLVVTVCDMAHEALGPRDGWLHWSLPDPAEAGTRRAFDDTVVRLDQRIAAVAPVAGLGPADDDADDTERQP